MINSIFFVYAFINLTNKIDQNDFDFKIDIILVEQYANLIIQMYFFFRNIQIQKY